MNNLNQRPLCKFCKRPCETKGIRNGKNVYRNICATCNYQRKRSGYVYSQHKLGQCQFCGFIPTHSCQLHIDHKDGDRRNNSLDNLQTLCANCHSLKTYFKRALV